MKGANAEQPPIKWVTAHELRREADDLREQLASLRAMFRKIGSDWYFDGHRYSLMHGSVKLNEAGEKQAGLRDG